MEGRWLSCGFFQFHIVAFCIWLKGKKKGKKGQLPDTTMSLSSLTLKQRKLGLEPFFSQSVFEEMWWCEDRQGRGMKQSKNHLTHSITTKHPVTEEKRHSLCASKEVKWCDKARKLNRDEVQKPHLHVPSFSLKVFWSPFSLRNLKSGQYTKSLDCNFKKKWNSSAKTRNFCSVRRVC